MNTNNTLSRLSEIATRIKELREIMGFSVNDMMQKTDVDEPTYLSYESGTQDIPFSFIHKCALAFGVGMCMTMVWEGLLVWGIVVGLIGIVLLLCLIPLCKGLK